MVVGSFDHGEEAIIFKCTLTYMCMAVHIELGKTSPIQVSHQQHFDILELDFSVFVNTTPNGNAREMEGGWMHACKRATSFKRISSCTTSALINLRLSHVTGKRFAFVMTSVVGFCLLFVNQVSNICDATNDTEIRIEHCYSWNMKWLLLLVSTFGSGFLVLNWNPKLLCLLSWLICDYRIPCQSSILVAMKGLLYTRLTLL